MGISLFRGKEHRMKRLILLFATMAAAMVVALLASVGALVALPLGPARGAAILPSGFTKTQIVSGLTYPMDMEFAPDGRLFMIEQAGRVRIAKPEGTLTTFLNISTKVDASGERGLQALTFDPGFSTNHYVYLQYTRTAPSPPTTLSTLRPRAKTGLSGPWDCATPSSSPSSRPRAPPS